MFAELEKLRERAEQLSSGMKEIRAAEPNVPITDSDESGAVTATIGADGLPDSWELHRDWKSRVRPAGLSGAFVTAMALAASRRLRTWDLQVRDRLGVDGDRPRAQAFWPTDPAPRPLSELLDGIREPSIPDLETPDREICGERAENAAGTVEVSVGPAGQVSVVRLDEEWVKVSQSVTIEGEVNFALRAALRKLDVQEMDHLAEARQFQADMSNIFAEAISHLKKFSSA